MMLWGSRGYHRCADVMQSVRSLSGLLCAGKSEPDLQALTREIDDNKMQIDELKRKLEEQRTLRQTALADAASAET